MKKTLLKLIELYQKYLSPDHSARGKARHPYGYCKYYPSCSEYAKQAIEIHGITRGGVLAIWRILKCNPFSNGGVDLVRSIRIIRT